MYAGFLIRYIATIKSIIWYKEKAFMRPELSQIERKSRCIPILLTICCIAYVNQNLVFKNFDSEINSKIIELAYYISSMQTLYLDV